MRVFKTGRIGSDGSCLFGLQPHDMIAFFQDEQENQTQTTQSPIEVKKVQRCWHNPAINTLITKVSSFNTVQNNFWPYLNFCGKDKGCLKGHLGMSWQLRICGLGPAWVFKRIKAFLFCCWDFALSSFWLSCGKKNCQPWRKIEPRNSLRMVPETVSTVST